MDVISLIKHKVSPAAKLVESAVTMSDWKKDEFAGVSDWIKDKEIRITKKKRDPFGSHDTGGSVGWIDSLPSWLIYNLKGMTPIALNELASSTVFDESTMAPAVFRSFGVDLRDVTHKTTAQTEFESTVKEVNELQRELEQAKKVKDRTAIQEAKQAIHDYPGNFNRTKARLGLTKTQLRHWKKKAEPLLLKKKRNIELTDQEKRKLRLYKSKMTGIYEKAMKVLNK
jgi:hypothetical protein